MPMRRAGVARVDFAAWLVVYDGDRTQTLLCYFWGSVGIWEGERERKEKEKEKRKQKLLSGEMN